MEKYNIRGEDAICILNKSSVEIEKEVNNLSTKLRLAKAKSPTQNILAVVLFAGRGLQIEGQ